MPAFGIGHLRNVDFNDEIIDYVKRINATLEPYGGRFRVHGTPRLEVLEGEWTDSLIVIEFPDYERGKAWYESPEYQELIPLRADNSEGDIFLVDGVDEGYQATELLAKVA